MKCIELINRYPKCEQSVNPTVEKWNNPNNVELWRTVWAEKTNIAYEVAGLDITVDHRSYERQGLDLIPTVHEGKADEQILVDQQYIKDLAPIRKEKLEEL